MHIQSGCFRRATALYAGDDPDLRGPLLEGMITMSIERVAEIMPAGEIAAVLSRFVRINEELLLDEVFTRPPGNELQQRLNELKQSFRFPIAVTTPSPAFEFLELLSAWQGGHLYQRVAWMLFEKQGSASERDHILSN